MPKVYRPLSLLPLLASVACGEVDLPTAPSAVEPVTVVAVIQQEFAPVPPSWKLALVPVVITYAQGTASQSLHVQWMGGQAVYPIEVRYAREATDSFVSIASFSYEGTELQYYPRPGGGRYTVTVAGVTSRVMFLDGEVRDSNAGESGSGNGGNSPSSPDKGPSTPTNGNGGDAGGSGSGSSGSTGSGSNGDSGSNGSGSGNSCQEDHNNGHGNDCDHHDSGNPGNGNKKPGKGKK